MTACFTTGCQVCKFMFEGDRLFFHVTGNYYKINSRFDCDSSCIVYLIGCKVCGMQHVGSTFTPFRTTVCMRKLKGLVEGRGKREKIIEIFTIKVPSATKVIF